MKSGVAGLQDTIICLSYTLGSEGSEGSFTFEILVEVFSVMV